MAPPRRRHVVKVNSGKEEYAEGAKGEERKGNQLSQAGRRSENKRWDDRRLVLVSSWRRPPGGMLCKDAEWDVVKVPGCRCCKRFAQSNGPMHVIDF